MPSEAQYYWEILFDLLESWKPRPREFFETVEERQRKLTVRIPKALKQYRNEVDAMAEVSSTDRRQKASAQARGVLGEAIVSRLLSSQRELLRIQDLESNKHIKLAKEKLEVVVEECFPLLSLLQQDHNERSDDGRHQSNAEGVQCASSSDPILPAMRGNLHLRILELHDVLTLLRGLEDSDDNNGNEVSLRNIIHCVERFVGFADNIGAKCGVLVCPPAVGGHQAEFAANDVSVVSDDISKKSAAIAATSTLDDQGYCTVM
ncbi:Hypothetical protein, putative [Bodo saltans]|uniref:Uncharacterized protein n=1 Tax=Bodo saltans TaxID=75058 RepID=A0A0S4IQK0_BODSA|nr:Hypothetical protein, putative [Bodo saltans]|eukprot:CUF25233.1 Hypothetical protein, putative [Bodo saltans]